MHPYAPPAAPIVPVSSPYAAVSFEASQRVAKLTIAVLGVGAAWPILGRLIHELFGPSHGKRITSAQFREIQNFGLAVKGIEMILFFTATVVFMVWSNRFAKAAAARGGTKWGPEWTVGAWFVPLANFVLPYVVTRDLWRATRNDGALLVAGWWALWLATTVLNIANAFQPQLIRLIDDPSTLISALYWLRSASILGSFACWAGVVFKLDAWSRTQA